MNSNGTNTGRMTNNEKILHALKEVDKKVSTTDLAEETGISIKNISRYLKGLEKEKLIKRTTVQQGKKRFVYVELITGRNSDHITSRKENKSSIDQPTGRKGVDTGRNSDHITSRKIKMAKKESSPIEGPLTVNQLFEAIIKYTQGRKAKGYSRINKILTSHDKNRNYQSHIIRDCLEILMEMGLITRGI